VQPLIFCDGKERVHSCPEQLFFFHLPFFGFVCSATARNELSSSAVGGMSVQFSYRLGEENVSADFQAVAFGF
jgi:hypothetical protein